MAGDDDSEAEEQPTEAAPAPKRKKLHPGIPFLTSFVVLAAVFYGFAWTDLYEEEILAPVANVQAAISGTILSALGQVVYVNGNVLRGNGGAGAVALEIKKGCDAVEATALYMAACLAFPVAAQARAVGVALGISVIFVMNVLRIVTLYLVAVYANDWFHTAHVDLWPALILVEAIGLWVLWARSSRKRSRLSRVS